MKNFTLLQKLFNTSSDGKIADLNVGEVWSYKTRSGEKSSTLTILKTEGSIVHICVDGLKVKHAVHGGGYLESIPHIPFDVGTLKKCLIKKIRVESKLPDFSEGYNEWKNNNGGAFAISVKEAVSYLEKFFSQ